MPAEGTTSFPARSSAVERCVEEVDAVAERHLTEGRSRLTVDAAALL